MVTTDDPALLFPPQSLEGFPGYPVAGRRRYDRIAGFFSSSLLEVAGEVLERMTPEGGETQEAVLSSKIEGTQAILGEVLKFEAGEADNGIKSMTGPRLREAVIRAPV